MTLAGERKSVIQKSCFKPGKKIMKHEQRFILAMIICVVITIIWSNRMHSKMKVWKNTQIKKKQEEEFKNQKKFLEKIAKRKETMRRYELVKKVSDISGLGNKNSVFGKVYFSIFTGFESIQEPKKVEIAKKIEKKPKVAPKPKPIVKITAKGAFAIRKKALESRESIVQDGQRINLNHIRVETQEYLMIWSNRGATLKSLKLKKFYHGHVNRKAKDWQKKEANFLTLIPEFSPQYSSLLLYGEETIHNSELKVRLDTDPWKVVKLPGKDSNELIFELGPIQIGANKQITYVKKFTFAKDEKDPKKQKLFSGEVIVKNLGGEAIEREHLKMSGGAGILIESNSRDNTTSGHVMFLNENNFDSAKEIGHTKLAKEKYTLKRPLRWIATLNTYFGHVFEPEKAEDFVEMELQAFSADENWLAEMKTKYTEWGEKLKIKDLVKQQQAITYLKTRPFKIPPQKSQSFKFRFYLGTKSDLANLNKNFSPLGDLGFFNIVSQFLLMILSFFYGIFKNYGIAILGLTITIKICMYPLTRKQQTSMQDYQEKMKIFQPEFKKLQEKYKNDRPKFQQEVMQLYKKHGVNPFPVGGCLPILIQLPIFLGLYRALYYSVKLRQASFLWISDLSMPDRLLQLSKPFSLFGLFECEYLNILPIIMTVAWLYQMKTAPKVEDPQMQQQQKMMMVMPIIIGFTFYKFASGLVLYWLVTQIFAVIEQAWIKKSREKKKQGEETLKIKGKKKKAKAS